MAVKMTLPLLFSCYAISAGVAIIIYAVIYLKAIKKIEVPEKASVK